ncbi:MAG: hypothetical protein ACFE7R_11340, partial [Candidatus Hodarchaeota archaeon]
MEQTLDSEGVRCVFCGERYQPSELVRYRGALACHTCAGKAKGEELNRQRLVNEWFYLGAVGSALGIIVFSFASVSAILFRLMRADMYYGGIAIVMFLQSIAFYGLYLRTSERYVVIPLFLGIAAGAINSIQAFLTVYPSMNVNSIYLVPPGHGLSYFSVLAFHL